jgi:hypothetical protein
MGATGANVNPVHLFFRCHRCRISSSFKPEGVQDTGHLFPDQQEHLAEALESTYQAAAKDRRGRPSHLCLVEPPEK